MIIDAQVHAYERNHAARPWAAVLRGPDEVSGDDIVAAMDQVGVAGAVLVSTHTTYRYDASYVLEVLAQHPGRFALVKPVDPHDPAVADVVAEWATTPGAVGIRGILMGPSASAHRLSGFDTMLAAAAAAQMPVNFACAGRLAQVAELARRHDDTTVIVDHLGLRQLHRAAGADPFADLPQLLALASYENVVVKVTGACTLSERAFPYPDIWDPLARVFEAFGLARCMWGTDWTRAEHVVSFREAVDAFVASDRLSDDDRNVLMCETLQRVYGWAPSPLPDSR